MLLTLSVTDKREWHNHFCWLPVLTNRSFYWLETVQRRLEPKYPTLNRLRLEGKLNAPSMQDKSRETVWKYRSNEN